MNVLLIHPPDYLSKSGELGQKQISIPVGLAYIASYIRERGIKVSVYDANIVSFRHSIFRDFIKDKMPDIVGISATTIQIMDAGYIADLIKSVDSRIVTVIGGAHVSAIPEQTLTEFSSFDFAVLGEGEETFYRLVLYLSGKGPFDNRSLCYRENGHLKKGEQRPLIENIDCIPPPAFDLFQLNYYKPHYSHSKGLSLPIFTTRGCPYECTFCSGPMGRKVRFRSIKKVIEELKTDIINYHPAQILIEDDTFTIKKSYVLELCEQIVKEGIHKEIEFICETRVDLIDRDMLTAMKKAGVRSVSFGIEAGDNYILNKVMKRITLNQAYNAVVTAKEVGLETDANFILGFPYENRQTIRKTIDFACSLPLDYVSFFLLVPYPGTEVARMADNNEGGLRVLSKDWNKYGKQTGGILALSEISYNRLKLYQLYAYIRFYARPKHFLNALRRITPMTIGIFIFQIIKSIFTGNPGGR